MSLVVVLTDRTEHGEDLCRLLSKERYQTVVVYEACDALCTVRSIHPHALVIDVTQPNGEAILLARTLGLLPDVPVVLLSSVAIGELEQLSAENPNVVCVLHRPCDPERILQAIHHAQDKRPELLAWS